LQEMTNFYFRPPYSVVLAYLEQHITDPHALPCEKAHVLYNGIKIDELVSFVSKFHEESRFEWIIQGNVTRDEALSMAQSVQSIIQKDKLTTDKTIVYRTVHIEPKTNFVYIFDNINPNEQNSAIGSYFQCGKLDDKGSCMLLVIESLLRDRFFNELRTKQALGYVAVLFQREFRCNEGLACVVQSAVKSPEYIWQRIKDFFDDSEKFIKELSDELFTTHVNSVVVSKKERDITLADEIYRNAFEVKKRQFVFDRREKHVAILEELKKEELLEFYEYHFVKNVRRLDIELLAAGHVEENKTFENENKEICDSMGIKRIKTKSIADFKRRNSLYPDFFTHN